MNKIPKYKSKNNFSQGYIKVTKKESLDKLTEQNKQTNTLLERERQHSRELERQLASKPNYTTTFIIIAIIATVVGFILAQIMK